MAIYQQTNETAAQSNGYVFRGSNMTASQVTSDAQRYMAEIQRSRLTVSVEMPWDDSLTAHTPVRLFGTGTGFDGLYKPDHIQRIFSSKAGSEQKVILSTAIS